MPGLPMKHLLLATLMSLALAACSDQGTPEQQLAADISAGQAVADRECKGCHGMDGKGAAPGIPHLAGQRGRYLMVALQEYKDNLRVHAALRTIAANMSEADTRAVAAYYASLPPIPAVKTDVFSPYVRGKVVAAKCAGCHGEDGNSTIAGTPSLAGQQPRYLVIAAQEYLTGLRETPPMHGLLRDLSRLDLESVALYFASQTPAQRGAPQRGNPAAGEPLTAMCGGCHGSHGVSTDSATPTLAAQDPDYLVNTIKAFRTTRKHELMQRIAATLSDQDVDNIVAFYTTQKSEAAERGQTLIDDIIDKCNRCHAGDKDNPALAIPIIHGQDKDYLTLALRLYRDDRRGNSMMHNISLPYSDSIIESLASYYSSQPSR